jgi:hypothetical protein
MSQLLKKIVIVFSVLVFILFIALIVSAWLLGAFSPVSIRLDDREGGFYLCAVEKVVYAKIPEQLAQIKSLSRADSLGYKYDGALIYSDPTVTALGDVLARAVILLKDSLSVEPPLGVHRLEPGKIISASIEANPAIAVFKIYPAISDWLSKNRQTYRGELPMIEIYSPPTFTVQMPLALK